MAKEFKLTRKEIKQPDPFVRVSSHIWEWLVDRRKQVGMALAVLTAAFIAGSIISNVMGAKERRAGESLSEALDQARRGVEGIDYAVPGEPTPFKSVQDRTDAVVKALEKVRTEFSGTRAARTATLHLGDYSFTSSKYEDAIRYFQEYVATSRPDDPYRVLALEGLGYTNEAKKDFPAALDYFDKMAKDSTKGFGKDRAAFHRARILEESGKLQEAAQAYESIKKDFAESPLAKIATERLGLLATRGVVAKADPAPAKAGDGGTAG
jgi:tetratricopeptide (TPR) repeat protein